MGRAEFSSRRNQTSSRTTSSVVPTVEPVARRPLAKVASTRRPVAAPSETSTLEDELWRLERLYKGNGSFAIEDVANGQRVVKLVHHCSDPDWEAVNWAPEGLRFDIMVPAGYPKEASAQPRLTISSPEGLPARFLHSIPLLFEESVAVTAANTAKIYRALQHVDRHLVPLWLKVRALEDQLAEKAKAEAEASNAIETKRHSGCEAANEACVDNKDIIRAPLPEKKPVANPWSAEEQARLEEALVEFRDETDTKRKWNLIAQRVGGSRSTRDCVARFRACRDFALGKTDNPDQAKAQEPEAESPVVQALPSSAAGWNAEDVRRTGVEVRLIGLTLEGFATLLCSVIRLQVVCGRCKKPAELESESGFGTDPRSAQTNCPICKQELLVRVAPNICHGGCPTIAHVLGVNCHPTQMLRSDFEACCGECTESIRIRSVGPGYRKRADCHSCHAKLNLSIEGADLLGHAVAHWRQIAADEGERLNARRQLQEARRIEKEMGIKAGQPLPDNGACKHYSKSHRWLRFPCCGRAFPCDTCHDEKTDHPHEWASRMLCGYCSHEQPFSRDKCVSCGAAQTRSRSSYWEGGEGCRSRATMSRNDPHKYRGLGKTASASKSAVSKRGAK